MKKKIIPGVIIMILISIFASGCATNRLGSFGADFGAIELPILGTQRFPYADTVRYFGYIEEGEKPDAVVDGKNVYYLYLWIPVLAPEIGIRMLSPVAGMVAPAEGDILDPSYQEKVLADPDSYFDTWIRFERALMVINPDDIEGVFDKTPWLTYNSNDDSREMPRQPSRRYYNSLMRLNAGEEPLIRGLYRVGFTSYKTGEVKGSFFAEVGAPIKLSGVVIAKNIEDLMAGIAAAE